MNRFIHKTALVLLWLNISVHTSFAQNYQYQKDKPGQYIIKNRLNNCYGTDKASLSISVRNLAEWFQKNDLLFNPLKGFDAGVSLYGNLCEPTDDRIDIKYGIECRLGFTFNYFYLEDGVFHTATDWLAHSTDVYINQPFTNLAYRFEEKDFQQGDDPRFETAINDAHKRLKKYYTIPQLEKEIASGVKLFKSGQLVISNPGRPNFWIPVTVKEIMEAMLNYYKIQKEIDIINKKVLNQKLADLGVKIDENLKIPAVYDMILQEYESFSDAEIQKQAFSSPVYGISGINTKGDGNQVVRFNPECWDRNLPVTSVQFVSTELGFRKTENLEEFLKDNHGLTDYESLFYMNLPVEKMGELIQTK